MKKKLLLKNVFIVTLAILFVIPVAACKETGASAGAAGTAAQTTASGTASPAAAEATPQNDSLGRYPEEITIHMGRQTLENQNLPNGDTYENNAYTRWLKDKLNIKIVDDFEAYGDAYKRQVSLVVSSGDIPDIMKVVEREVLKEVYDNDLIADLTDVYNAYASENLKSIYDSFQGRAFNNVLFDGRMMALPGTNNDSGPCEVWIRQDWMEQLGTVIDSDKNSCISLSELESVAKEFINKNPGNADKPVGFAFAPWLSSTDSDGTYTMNAIAYAYGAVPKTWLMADGKVIYGSNSNEMMESMKKVAEWFKSGLVDPQLGTRTWDDITALLSNNKMGIVFGSWHIPDWLLNNVRALNKNATFEAYALESANGKVFCKHNDAAAGYMVVSKECKYPEAVIKIANLFYDEMENSKTLAQDYPDVAKYQADAMDGSVRPLNIEVRPYTSLVDNYSDIQRGVSGQIKPEEVRTVESRNIVKNVTKYLADPKNADDIDWSKYHSRMVGLKLFNTLLENNTFEWVSPVFPLTTPTMETNNANLKTLEEEAFIRMATGAVDVEEGFAKFVKDWQSTGGDQIISEIEEQLK